MLPMKCTHFTIRREIQNVKFFQATPIFAWRLKFSYKILFHSYSSSRFWQGNRERVRRKFLIFSKVQNLFSATRPYNPRETHNDYYAERWRIVRRKALDITAFEKIHRCIAIEESIMQMYSDYLLYWLTFYWRFHFTNVIRTWL